MKVIIEAPFDLKENEKSEIESKVNKLEKYHNNITRGEVYFKMDDGTKPDVILAEVQLHIPGPVVFASETDSNYMTAMTGAVNKVKRQLKKNQSQKQAY